jgi:Rps23 Pro-64 3,4-dihydroxylase Tpa1-like proline 4-hydroxylase
MGGGLNISEKGGMLDTHVDGNYKHQTGLYRRLNCIIYLTKNWRKYDGQLCLYNKKGSNLIKLIEPKFNKLLVFNTNYYNYHGIPNTINFPKNNPRRLIIYTIIQMTREKFRNKY